MEYVILRADTPEEARAEFVRFLAHVAGVIRAADVDHPAVSPYDALSRGAIIHALEALKETWEQARIVPKAAQ